MRSKSRKKNAPICITGGNGFVGTHLVRLLLKEGWGPISVIDHNPPREDVAGKVRFFQADFSDVGVLAKAIMPGGILIHLAGISNQATAEKDPLRDADVSVIGSLKLLEVATQKKIEKVVFMSSAPAVYGGSKKLPAEIDTLPRPRSVYGITKLAIELYVRHYAERWGFSYVILRSANAYGPGQFAKTHGVVSKFAFNVLSGKLLEIWGSPNSKRDFIFVEDVARAIVASLKPKVRNVTLNVASGKGTTLGNLIRMIEKASGNKAKVDIKEQRFIDVPDLYFSIRDTKKILGWTPKITFKEGVARTVDWIRETAI